MRQPKDDYFLDMLQLIASRATCPRRQVGAIITDVAGHILSTGYNGVPTGVQHCTDLPCPGARGVAGDTATCYAVHAEQNALLQCADLDRARYLYVSCTPCFTCAKMIANTKIRWVISRERYADQAGADLLTCCGVRLALFNHGICPGHTEMFTLQELRYNVWICSRCHLPYDTDGAQA